MYWFILNGNNLAWARLKPGSRNSVLVSHWGEGAQARGPSSLVFAVLLGRRTARRLAGISFSMLIRAVGTQTTAWYATMPVPKMQLFYKHTHIHIHIGKKMHDFQNCLHWKNLIFYFRQELYELLSYMHNITYLYFILVFLCIHIHKYHISNCMQMTYILAIIIWMYPN